MIIENRYRMNSSDLNVERNDSFGMITANTNSEA